MSLERTSCVHRGNTYFGDFQHVGQGSECVVRVHYRGASLDEKAGGRLPEIVAHHLLKELVVREVIAMKVEEAERALQDGCHRNRAA